MSIRPIDADNHYYEPLDAFTRYLDPAFKRRGVRLGGGMPGTLQGVDQQAAELRGEF